METWTTSLGKVTPGAAIAGAGATLGVAVRAGTCPFCGCAAGRILPELSIGTEFENMFTAPWVSTSRDGAPRCEAPHPYEDETRAGKPGEGGGDHKPLWLTRPRRWVSPLSSPKAY